VVGGPKVCSSTCSPSEDAWTANPWLWLVISTTPSAAAQHRLVHAAVAEHSL
jgi:hypothetical protein